MGRNSLDSATGAIDGSGMTAQCCDDRYSAICFTYSPPLGQGSPLLRRQSLNDIRTNNNRRLFFMYINRSYSYRLPHPATPFQLQRGTFQGVSVLFFTVVIYSPIMLWTETQRWRIKISSWRASSRSVSSRMVLLLALLSRIWLFSFPFFFFFYEDAVLGVAFASARL